MLKKQRISRQFNSTSLASISELRNNYQRQIEKLFQVGKWQQFELDYLYQTEHFTTCQNYQQLVQMLQRYNQQAKQFNSKNQITGISSSFNFVKLACIKIIYKQMLIMATMNNKELRQNKLSEKLKDWFQHLTDIRNFFEGVHLKKKNFHKIENEEEKIIRSQYISNVFDQIDDYLRKRMDYKKQSLSQQASPIKQKTNDASGCNLPSIDIMLYKKEDQKMRQHREKQFDKYYITTMINNRNKMRQTSMTKIRNKYNTRLINSNSEHNDISMRNSTNKLFPLAFYGKKNTYFNKQNLTVKHSNISKRQLVQPYRLSLGSINGINLIYNKLQ